MSVMVVAGATIQCSFGQGAGNLNVTSQMSVLLGGKPVATVQDTAAIVNVSSCGMCTSLLNPQVAAATSAALGVLTPQPCMPVCAGTWLPLDPYCLIGGIPCLKKESALVCSYGGSISVANPGQMIVK